MKRTTLLLILAFAGVLMVWTSCLAAQSSTGQNQPRLQCQQRFSAMDTDHNGQVSEAEFMAVPHRRVNAKQMFQSMARGKGYITQAEFCANKGLGGRGGNGRGGKGQGRMR